jgi:hypothetical protein
MLHHLLEECGQWLETFEAALKILQLLDCNLVIDAILIDVKNVD